MTNPNALLSLLRLVSPALPVGAFAYSQGLELAVERGWLKKPKDVQQWLSGVMFDGLSMLDIPLLLRMYKAVSDEECFNHWNNQLLACRETAELRLEEEQMGKALQRLLLSLNIHLPDMEKPTWVGLFAVAANRWNIDATSACHGYVWSWLENQLAAAAKTVPIGQTDVQLISQALLPDIVKTVERGCAVKDEGIAGGTPGLAMASMLHETQYSRLFRS